MGTTVTNSGRRTTSWIGWLFRGIGLGLLGCVLIWAANTQFERAQRVMSSTFQVQRGILALGLLLLTLVGVVFTVIVLVSRVDPRERSALLIGGAVPPLVLMLMFWDAFGPMLLGSPNAPGRTWVISNTTQTAAAMAFGVMVTTLAWQYAKRPRNTDHS